MKKSINLYINRYSKNMTQKTPKFISYKKLAIFGSVGSGKSSLIERLESGMFPDSEIENNEGKVII